MIDVSYCPSIILWPSSRPRSSSLAEQPHRHHPLHELPPERASKSIRSKCATPPTANSNPNNQYPGGFTLCETLVHFGSL